MQGVARSEYEWHEDVRHALCPEKLPPCGNSDHVIVHEGVELGVIQHGSIGIEQGLATSDHLTIAGVHFAIFAEKRDGLGDILTPDMVGVLACQVADGVAIRKLKNLRLKGSVRHRSSVDSIIRRTRMRAISQSDGAE